MYHVVVNNICTYYLVKSDQVAGTYTYVCMHRNIILKFKLPRTTNNYNITTLCLCAFGKIYIHTCMHKN